MDLLTAQTVPIALQPRDASFVAGQMSFIVRSQPAWSPDGKLLAWTEITLDQAALANPVQQDERLMTYDTSTKSLRTLIPKLTAHLTIANYPLLSEVSLGSNGLIAVNVSVSRNLDSNSSNWLIFYNKVGNQLSKLEKVTQSDANYEYSQLIWLSGFDQPYLSCVTCTTKIDPFTGNIEPLGGALELYGGLAPDKLSLSYGSDSGDESNVTWVIALKSERVSSFDSLRLSNISDVAISPDGTQIAAANYAGQGTTAGVDIYRVQNNRKFKVTSNVLGLGWGPIAWRVHSKSIH